MNKEQVEIEKKPSAIEFGQWMKQMREARDVTQVQMANILCSTQSRVSKMEAGLLEPSLQDFLFICAKLQLDENDALLCVKHFFTV